MDPSLGAVDGQGWSLRDASTQSRRWWTIACAFKADYVLAVSLVVATVALVAIRAVELIEGRLTRWAD